MISDVLSDAADQIRNYQRSMPEVYGSIKADIDRVLENMDSLRIKLDTPPRDWNDEH